MSFIYLFLIGILIGTAMVIPGVSGAVIAVIFGVYDKMIYALNNIFKDFKKQFIFLSILALGILIGAIWFSNILIFLYERHEILTKYSFIGLILGGVPYLFKDVLKKENERINYLALIITIVLSIFIWFISKNDINMLSKINESSLLLKFLLLFISGIIYSIGKVVPGISGSFLLIIIGMYEYVLSIMSHPFSIGLKQIDSLVPFVIGLFFGVFVLIKVMKFLLDRKFGLIYSVIIGFVVASTISLVPTDFSIVGIVFMAFSFLLTYKLVK